ncbi:hypothetical protein CAPTEDRAFT_188066 [Capitella teleta]|uniref:Endonuclease/exonuclease/phosphatase domain-containing protein n=1 Tax=Capitella teleta TaxID=283909 RepID=R7V875_CAPTE|nr:hypothetical protein CAPTEDRAFT_188066 [Capitella teleta]|eukprot:ELU14729.1 hypothetical protein CAPTEDRAFT_188066 [Capitella teleta]
MDPFGNLRSKLMGNGFTFRTGNWKSRETTDVDQSRNRTSLFSANREVTVIDQRKTHNENLLIVLINPWSICNKAEDINDFIIEYNIDILAITETWLTGTACDGPTINALLPNGYEIIHAPRRTRGGGTALVYHQSLNVTRVAVSSASFEVLECVIKGPIVLRICVVYQPYRTALFIEEFSSYLAGLATSPGHLLVLGDFNLHVDDPLDKCAQDFLTSMSSLGLEQHVSTLTHRNGHTLDLVLTPLGNPLDLTWKSIDYGFQDHYALFIQVAISKPPLPRKLHLDPAIMPKHQIGMLKMMQITDSFFPKYWYLLSDIWVFSSRTIRLLG